MTLILTLLITLCSELSSFWSNTLREREIVCTPPQKMEPNEVLLLYWSPVVFNMFPICYIKVYFDIATLYQNVFRIMQFWIKYLD